ncbi:MAG: AAA family ATPase [Trebonia sp.]
MTATAVQSGVALEFLVTKEHRPFVEFAAAVREHRYIGVYYGPPGVGKTVSARRYTDWDRLGPSLEDTASVTSTRPTTPTRCSTPRPRSSPPASSTKTSTCSVALLALAIHRRHGQSSFPTSPEEHVELVIVDEADRLKTSTLEQLRDFFDRHHLGLILIGMPGLEKRLARYPQLYSRVGFAHQYRPLSADELRHVLTHHWQRLGLQLEPSDYTDAEAIAAISRTTNGNFRLIHRLFAQVTRILEINHLQTITAEVVDAARQTLVIGQA